MPRVYKCVSSRARTLINVLERASEDIDNGCSIRESVKKCGCDRTTFKRFFDIRATNALGNFA